jgi:hypothetical protein
VTYHVLKIELRKAIVKGPGSHWQRVGESGARLEVLSGFAARMATPEEENLLFYFGFRISSGFLWRRRFAIQIHSGDGVEIGE